MGEKWWKRWSKRVNASRQGRFVHNYTQTACCSSIKKWIKTCSIVAEIVKDQRNLLWKAFTQMIIKYFIQKNTYHSNFFLKTAVNWLLYGRSCNRIGLIIGSTAIAKTLSNIFGMRRFSTFEQSWVMAGFVLTSISQRPNFSSIMKSIPKS